MIESILQKALDGKRVEGAEALQLFACTDMNLLGNAATRLMRKRRETNDNVVTYIIDRNINYTPTVHSAPFTVTRDMTRLTSCPSKPSQKKLKR
jgi:hypothetical protein